MNFEDATVAVSSSSVLRTGDDDGKRRVEGFISWMNSTQNSFTYSAVNAEE
jgi:hypothetical protein